MINIADDLRAAFDEGYKARDAEIVRCKDCRYSRPYMLGLYRCDRTDIALATGEDEYCSRGERKEDVSD